MSPHHQSQLWPVLIGLASFLLLKCGICAATHLALMHSVLLQVKADNPNIAFTEIAKVLGERWRDVSAEDKKPYEEQAAQDKTRYEEEMAAYKATKAEAPESE